MADAEIPRQTNEDGIYVWENAPSDEVTFSIIATGYLDKRNFKLTAREEEYLVEFSRPLIVSGTVVNAKTKQPVEAFDVIQGIKLEQKDSVSWERDRSKVVKAGRYESRFDFPYPGHLVRIEATGYEPAESRIFHSDEGSVTLDFDLKPVAAVKGTVTTVDGQPVAGAQVVLATQTQRVFVENGRLTDVRDQTVAISDADGRFELPSQSQAFTLLCLHDLGTKTISGKEFRTGQTLELEPWATISGTVMIGTLPAAHTGVTLNKIDSKPYDQPQINVTGRTETNPRGHYSLPRVLPIAEFSVQRVIPHDRGGQTSTHGRRVVTKPGQKYDVNIGGVGRPVTGHATVPKTDATYDWGVCVITPNLNNYEFPEGVDEMAPDERQAWLDEWSRSEEGMAYTEKSQHWYAILIGDDGRFLVEDLPAGEYTLSLSIIATTASHQYGVWETLGDLRQNFTVPEMSGGRSNQPLDLGNLTIKLRNFLNVGDTAPNFQTTTLNGEPLQLSDYAGKYLLLEFWATYCGPSIGATPNFEKTYKRFQKDGRFDIIIVSMDHDADTVAKHLQEHPMPGIHCYLGTDSDARYDYGVQSLPSLFLIGPDGKVIAKNLWNEGLVKKIGEVLH